MEINRYRVDFGGKPEELPQKKGGSSNENISKDLQELIPKLIEKLPKIQSEKIREIYVSRADSGKLHLEIKTEKDTSFDIDDAECIKKFEAIADKVGVEFHKIHLEKKGKHKDLQQIIQIVKSVSFYFRQVRPKAKKQINEALKNSENPEDIYIHPEELYREIKTSSTGWESFFSPEEFHKLIDKMLVKDISNRNKKTWNQDKLNQLNATRVAAKIAENKIDKKNIDSELKTIDHMKIPIEALLKLEINNSNIEAISLLWKSLLTNSFDSIELSDEKDASKQISSISSAKRYLSLRHQMPNKIKARLQDDFNRMDSKCSLDKAMAHVLTTSVQDTEKKELLIGAIDDPAKLIKSVDSKVRECIPRDVIEDGVFPLGGYLSGQHPNLDEIFNEIRTDLDPEKENSELPTIIKNLFYHEMERYAIEEIGAVSAQIKILREQRSATDVQKDRAYNPLYLESTIQELKQSLNIHPSGLTVDEQIGLILLNKCFYNEELSDDLKVIIEYKLKKIKIINAKTNLEKLIEEINDNKTESPKKEMFIEALTGVEKELSEVEKELSKVENKTINKKEQPLTESEKIELVNFLAKSAGNENLKKKLEKFLPTVLQEKHQTFTDSLKEVASWIWGIKTKKPQEPQELMLTPCGVGENAILQTFFLIKYTQDANACLLAVDKAGLLLDKYKNNDSINIEDKLTLKECGQLQMMSKLNEEATLYVYKNQEVIKKETNFNNFYEKSEKAKKIIETISEEILEQANTHYADGTLIATNAKKREAFLSKEPSLEERMTSLISDGLLHGSILFHDKEGKLQRSHLVEKYKTETFDVYPLLTSDIYEMDPSKLVNPALYRLLEKEKKWTEKSASFNNKYREIVKDLHIGLQEKKGKKAIKIYNDDRKRKLAGFGDHHKLMRLVGRFDVEGHKQKDPFDADKVYRQYYESENFERKQICSEFATKATIAALMQLNKKIIEDILSEEKFERFKGEEVLKKLENLDLKPSPDEEKYLRSETLKSNIKLNHIKKNLRKKMLKAGYDSTEISAIFSLCENKAINLPYPPNERLEAVHPGRMVKLLVNADCVEKKAPPEAVTRYIQVS
jgi:hypothetical protein